jgi:hypothetical protein
MRRQTGHADDIDAAYAYGPLRGDWCTLVQVHFLQDNIWITDLGEALSEALNTYVLTFELMEGEVLSYHLHHRGELLDSYDSDPTYFEHQSLPQAEAVARRHHPEAFAPLLPVGVGLERLRALFDQRSWRAYDCGELDDKECRSKQVFAPDDFLSAKQRMAAFGNLLCLHGAAAGYPYVDGAAAGPTAWFGFTLATYVRQ